MSEISEATLRNQVLAGAKSIAASGILRLAGDIAERTERPGLRMKALQAQEYVFAEYGMFDDQLAVLGQIQELAELNGDTGALAYSHFYTAGALIGKADQEPVKANADNLRFDAYLSWSRAATFLEVAHMEKVEKLRQERRVVDKESPELKKLALGKEVAEQNARALVEQLGLDRVSQPVPESPASQGDTTFNRFRERATDVALVGFGGGILAAAVIEKLT